MRYFLPILAFVTGCAAGMYHFPLDAEYKPDPMQDPITTCVRACLEENARFESSTLLFHVSMGMGELSCICKDKVDIIDVPI